MRKQFQLSTPVKTALLTFSVLTITISFSGCSLLEKLPIPGKPAQETSTTTAPAAKADPKAIKKHMDAGNALAKQSKWNEALSEFAQVLALDPNYTPAHVQMGWAYAELKQWDDAKQHLLQAVSNDANNASAHANLAWVYAEQKRWNDAQQEARKAIDLDPKNPYPHATLAWAYQETKQDELAISEYEKSLELNPSLDNSDFALGVTYCNKGMSSQAQKHYSHLIKLKSPKAAELQARLAKGCGPKK